MRVGGFSAVGRRTIWLPEPLENRLDREAARQGTTFSRFVVSLVRLGLADLEPRSTGLGKNG